MYHRTSPPTRLQSVVQSTSVLCFFCRMPANLHATSCRNLFFLSLPLLTFLVLCVDHFLALPCCSAAFFHFLFFFLFFLARVLPATHPHLRVVLFCASICFSCHFVPSLCSSTSLCESIKPGFIRFFFLSLFFVAFFDMPQDASLTTFRRHVHLGEELLFLLMLDLTSIWLLTLPPLPDSLASFSHSYSVLSLLELLLLSFLVLS